MQRTPKKRSEKRDGISVQEQKRLRERRIEGEKQNDLLNQPSHCQCVHDLVYNNVQVDCGKTMRNNLKSDFPLDIKGVC